MKGWWVDTGLNAPCLPSSLQATCPFGTARCDQSAIKRLCIAPAHLQKIGDPPPSRETPSEDPETALTGRAINALHQWPARHQRRSAGLPGQPLWCGLGARWPGPRGMLDAINPAAHPPPPEGPQSPPPPPPAPTPDARHPPDLPDG